MNTFSKGVAVALLHTLIVLSLGGRLLYDRSHRPRVWVRTGSMDPNLPIRGRYLTLRLQVSVPWFQGAQGQQYVRSDVTLGAEKDALVAYKSESNTGLSVTYFSVLGRPPSEVTYLDQPVDFFIPEHAQLPRLHQGEELWAEVTIPRKGPPRPIQLALKKGTEWTPLSYR
jgi:hypothetical protein